VPSPRKPKKVGLVSLGCPKNQVDAEVLLGRLRHEGYELTADAAEADAIVVNTCGFIEEAKQESIEAILEAARALEGKEDGRLIVAGCLSQRYSGQLAEEMPEVSAFVPLGEVGLMASAVEGRSPRLPDFPEPHAASFLDSAAAERLLTSAAGSAYLKISEGCDHACSFCAIPSMRGRHRSRPLDDVTREAEALAERGVRELVLVAQDSSAYGQDLGLRHGLAALLERLQGLPGLSWIRVMYAYPNTLDDATLDAMAALPKVCEYLDIPLQHASRRVLAGMRRGGSAESLLRLLERARESVPELVLRSTFIVGFPGEEESDVAELLAFTREAAFDHLGVFTYSREEATTAHPLGDPVPEEQKQERRARLMQQQSSISRERNAGRVGRRLEVLVEGAHPESEHLLAGRWRGQAPEVDGTVILTDGEARPGSIVEVVIDEAHEYDLVGRVVGERA
jgi:ribosomal protein S12 methylthiotransferase